MTEPNPPGWAPFPVQDWRGLPVDPLREPAAVPVRGTAHLDGDPGSAPEAHGWSPVDPAWRAPRRYRQWWLPLVALLVVGALVAGGAWAARQAAQPSTDALRYVPADGAVAYDRVDLTREALTTVQSTVTESARFSGTSALLTGDSFFTTRALHQDFDDPTNARLWRTTTTTVDEVAGSTQTVRFYRVRGSVELAGEAGPSATTYAYEPALVELPAQVAAGQEWSGTGSAGDTTDYRSRFRARPGPGDCLDVEGEIAYLTKAGTPNRTVALRRTWCPGQGVVVSSESFADLRTVTTRVDRPAPDPRTTTDTPVRWDAPSRWTPKTYATSVFDARNQPRPMNGTSDSDLTPVRTASGLVVEAMEAPDDLLAITPKTLDAWTPAWRAHPGGSITSLAVFGDVVLVTTSARRLVAYSDGGVRLWDRELTEIAPTPAVRVSDDDAVLVDLAGNLIRVAVATGEVRWEREVGSDVNRPPATGAGLVVVADRGSRVSAFDAATGGTRWTEDLDGKAVAVVGRTVAVVQDQAVHGLDATTGRHRFVQAYGGILRDLRPYGDRLALASTTATVLLTPDGALSPPLPAYRTLTPTASHLVGWTDDRVDVLDPAGTTVASWPARPTSQVSSSRPALATPQGLLLFAYTRDWTFDAWTAEG